MYRCYHKKQVGGVALRKSCSKKVGVCVFDGWFLEMAVGVCCGCKSLSDGWGGGASATCLYTYWAREIYRVEYVDLLAWKEKTKNSKQRSRWLGIIVKDQWEKLINAETPWSTDHRAGTRNRKDPVGCWKRGGTKGWKKERNKEGK